MKKIKVSAERQVVFDEVSLSSGYRAVKAKGDAGGERIAMTGSDRRLAGNFFDDCVGQSLTALRPFVRGVINDDEKLELELAVEDSWVSSLIEAVERHLKNFMSKGVLGRWLETAGESSSVVTMAESERSLNELIATLYHREAPVRGKS